MIRNLTMPLTLADIQDLRAGDIITLSGQVVTGRDEVYHRIVRENMPSPVDLRGCCIFHAGPIVSESPQGHRLVSVGPTSSIRMEEDCAEFFRLTGVRVAVGKGGMGPKTAEGCRRYGAIHCIYPGGCAVTAASAMKEIKGVYWRELGMPECMWVMEAEKWGPLIVSIDTLGDSLYAQNQSSYRQAKEKVLPPLLEQLRRIMGGGEKEA